jgi:hypothetical protein
MSEIVHPKPDRIPGHPNLKRGGTTSGGRKRSIVRDKALKGFEAALPWLVDVARGKVHLQAKDRLQAIQLLARYGLGDRAEEDEMMQSGSQLNALIVGITQGIHLRAAREDVQPSEIVGNVE